MAAGSAKLFIGEAALVDPLVRKAINAVIAPERQSLDLEIIRGGERDLGDAIAALQQIGMFSAGRFVWVKGLPSIRAKKSSATDSARSREGDDDDGDNDADNDSSPSAEDRAEQAAASASLSKDKKSEGGEEEEREVLELRAADEQLEDFLAFLGAGLPEDTRLWVSAVDLKKTTKLYKHFAKLKAVVDLRTKDAGKDSKSWREEVRTRILAAGLQEPSAAVLDAILKRGGAQGGELFQEVDRICSPLAEGDTLDVDLVRENMRDLSTAWVFDLTGALGKRDLGTASRLLGALLRNGDVPQRILPVLAGHIYDLYGARLFAGRLPRGVLASNNGKRFVYDVAPKLEDPWLKSRSPWRAWFLMQEARNFGARELRRLHEGLLRVDVEMKSSPTPPAALLADFLQQACIKSDRS